jgi:hypothetical protein
MIFATAASVGCDMGQRFDQYTCQTLIKALEALDVKIRDIPENLRSQFVVCWETG